MIYNTSMHKYKQVEIRQRMQSLITDEFKPVPSCKEKFIKRCKAITERISEESSEVEGEWLTYDDMVKLEFST